MENKKAARSPYHYQALRLKQRREDNGLTQDQLSKLLGYKNGQYLSNIERGLCGIPQKNIKHFADILRVNKNEIINDIIIDKTAYLKSYLSAQWDDEVENV